jgi:hypothetical protein
VEHDASDWKQACERAMEWGDTLYTGLFFEKELASLTEVEPILREGGPIAKRPLALTEEQASRLLSRLR